MELAELLSFDIEEKCLVARNRRFYFYEVISPNFSIMNNTDKAMYYGQLEDVMKSATENDFFICALDKTVSLAQNKEFVLSLDDRYGKIKDALLDSCTKMEETGDNTQRSYYFGIGCTDVSQAQKFETILHSSGTEVTQVGRQGLIAIMRCFYLREFVDSDIHIDPNEDPLIYGSGKKKVTMSPIVKHLLPVSMSFDSQLDTVVQPNFRRKTLVVRNLPQRVESYKRDMFRNIFQLANTTVMMRLSDMSFGETKDLVDRQYNNATAGMRSIKATTSLESKSDAEVTSEFYMSLQKDATEGGGLKRVNIYVEAYGTSKEELDENVRRVKSTCTVMGITLEDFILQQRNGFFGVSPIGYDTRSKKLANNIPSKTLGFLYPFSSSYINDVTGMLLGRTVDKGIVSLDVWVRTIYRTNYNFAIIGDSGQGKSYLLKKMISQQRLRNIVTWVLDSENEFSDLVRGLGGTVIDCTSGDFAINPLQVRTFNLGDDEQFGNGPAEPTTFKENNPFFQHLGWLKDFVPVLFPNITDLQVAAFIKIVRDVYKQLGIDDRTNFIDIAAAQYPILSDIYTYINDVLQNPVKYPFYNMIEVSDLKALLLRLDDVCFGSLSPQFNQHTNATESSLVNLNIQGLLMGDKNNMQAVLFNYTTYLWGKILERQGNTMLIIDELYLYANEDNPILLKYLNSYERRSRKYFASLGIATQKIMDCLHPNIAQWTSALFDTPTYKFVFFPGEVDLEVVKTKLRLTDGEVSEISRPERRKCLLKVGKDKYLMHVGTLPFEESLFGKGGGL